jgi:hypothetical protein
VKDGVDVSEAVGIYEVPKNTKLAGKIWFADFMKRHQKLSLRQPQLPSLVRVCEFSEVAVHAICDVFVNTVFENTIAVSRISNMDETSRTVVQRPAEITSQKGKDRIGAI